MLSMTTSACQPQVAVNKPIQSRSATLNAGGEGLASPAEENLELAMSLLPDPQQSERKNAGDPGPAWLVATDTVRNFEIVDAERSP